MLEGYPYLDIRQDQYHQQKQVHVQNLLSSDPSFHLWAVCEKEPNFHFLYFHTHTPFLAQGINHQNRKVHQLKVLKV